MAKSSFARTGSRVSWPAAQGARFTIKTAAAIAGMLLMADDLSPNESESVELRGFCELRRRLILTIREPLCNRGRIAEKAPSIVEAPAQRPSTNVVSRKIATTR